MQLTSCLSSRYLEKGEYLLYDVDVEVDNLALEEGLYAALKQKPNRKWFGISREPYLYLYYQGEKSYKNKRAIDSLKLEELNRHYEEKITKVQTRLSKNQHAYLDKKDRLFEKESSMTEEQLYDKLFKLAKNMEKDSLRYLSKIQKLQEKQFDKGSKLRTRLAKGNWRMRLMGEKPVLYDSTKTRYSLNSMESYLHSKGYLNGEVAVEVDTTGKFVQQVYTVTPGPLSKVATVSYTAQDPSLLQYLEDTRNESVLEAGIALDRQYFSEERRRIATLMKNNGYYDLTIDYIYFELDTAKDDHRVDINVILNNRSGNVPHQRYTLQGVSFENDMSKRTVMDTVKHQGVLFYQGDRFYKPKALTPKIHLTDGVYSQKDVQDTRAALGAMDVFKFVDVQVAKKDSTTLTAHVITNSLDKYQYSFETGLNMNDRFPGPFTSFTLTNRNVFNGGEVLQLQGRFSLEAQASTLDVEDQLYTGQELGVNTSLLFPRVVFPMSESLKERLFVKNTQTLFLTGATFVERPEYKRLNLQGVFGYQWRNQHQANFNVNLFDIGVTSTPEVDEAFLDRLREIGGEPLVRNFDSGLVSSTNAYYTKATGQFGMGQLENTSFIKLFAELGGNTLDFIDQQFLGDDEQILGLPYYRFLKFSAELRKAIRLGYLNQQLASRLYIGVARSLGGEESSLPYEKYFFSGGSNSNRAWRPRRIGPGAYQQTDEDTNFEQPGEVIIEGNLEWRSKMFGFIHGALFLDASNVWFYQKQYDEDNNLKEGAHFEFSDFWKEFAIGYGAGLRLDFTYVLLRFDVGFKMYDPSLSMGDRFLLKQNFLDPTKAEFNIAIGYPF
ncbi:BamA/TamA family outer membrane protein [Algivirga pacifica]|uniref:BamA/TamA family outer membrane protein n=2 Tax=Algivirga pacifica TaxID=1162670 RepID=A0ABP9DKH2_9BACT